LDKLDNAKLSKNFKAVAKTQEGFAMDNQFDEGDERVAGDLLVGAPAIKSYLIYLGWPASVDPYYLRRVGKLPIGKTADEGGQLAASKRRLKNRTEKITRGNTAA
jgi:hypothetical protein